MTFSEFLTAALTPSNKETAELDIALALQLPNGLSLSFAKGPITLMI